MREIRFSTIDVGELAALGEGFGDRALEEGGIDGGDEGAGGSGSAARGAAGEERGEQGGGRGHGHGAFEPELEEPAPGDVGIEDFIHACLLIRWGTWSCLLGDRE